MPEEVGTVMPTEGAAEVVETQNEGLEAVESTEVGSESAEVEGQQQAEEAQPKGGPQPKARQVIDKYLKSEEYKHLKEANPQLAKAINFAHHVLIDADTMLQPFGGLSGLKKIVESLDMAGGIDSLPQMAERLQEYEATDEALASGDTSWLDGVVTDMPDVFKRMVPEAVNRLAQVDPEGYAHMTASIMAQEFYRDERNGLFDYVVESLRALPQTEENAKTRKLLTDVYNWVKGIKEKASTQPKQTAKPNELSQKEQELSQREEGIALNTANKSVMEHAYPLYAREAAKLGLKLEGADLEDFKGYVDKNIQMKIGADAGYKRLFAPLLKKRDSDGLAKLTKQYVDKFAVKAVSEVYNERYKGRGRFANIKQQVVKKAAPQGTKPAPNGAKPAQLTRMPKVGNGPGDINKRLTTQKMFSQGQAYLNDGRFVTFQRS